MKYIKLTQGQWAIVDDEDFEWLIKYKWYANYDLSTRGYYAMRNIPLGNGKRKHLKMHRVIMNAKQGEQIDHKNRDSLDNRKQNLRFATPSQNQANSKIRSDNTSGYKGVVWYKNYQKWQVRIRYQGKRIYLGSFNNKEDAALVYNIKAKQLFGEYALLNKIKK